MVKGFVGYDTVVMNWLISLYGGRGFLYSVHSNELFNLNYAAEFIESTEVQLSENITFITKYQAVPVNNTMSCFFFGAKIVALSVISCVTGHT